MNAIKCRYCGKAIEEGAAVKTVSYWHSQEFKCHAECKASGEKAEAFECQKIDADCNDCAFFERGPFVNFPHRYYMGTCGRSGADVAAFAKTCSARPCFQHRLSDGVNVAVVL
jgi:hypothetical protein